MKLLLPRWGFWFALAFLAIGVLGVRDPRTSERIIDLAGAWLMVFWVAAA